MQKKFIRNSQFVNWFNTEHTIYFCVFDKNHYSDSLFDCYSIQFPPLLEKSVVSRRAEFLAGRYCAKNVLANYGLASFAIGAGPHRNPIWPDGFCGSISHSAENAVAVAGRGREGVGIDIEAIIQESEVSAIKALVVDDSESALLENSPGGLLKNLTFAFSAKESFFKSVYPSVGRYFGFEEIAIRDIDHNTKIIKMQVNRDLCKQVQKGSVFYAQMHQLSEKSVVTLVQS